MYLSELTGGDIVELKKICHRNINTGTALHLETIKPLQADLNLIKIYVTMSCNFYE